jgi:disulfide oxidoreductase YuzD
VGDVLVGDRCLHVGDVKELQEWLEEKIKKTKENDNSKKT